MYVYATYYPDVNTAPSVENELMRREAQKLYCEEKFTDAVEVWCKLHHRNAIKFSNLFSFKYAVYHMIFSYNAPSKPLKDFNLQDLDAMYFTCKEISSYPLFRDEFTPVDEILNRLETEEGVTKESIMSRYGNNFTSNALQVIMSSKTDLESSFYGIRAKPDLINKIILLCNQYLQRLNKEI